MLEIKDLAVSYGSITALHDVSLKVAKGDIVTLIGANGAGKSTTLRAISGLLKAQSGSIKYEGEEIANERAAQDRGARHFPRAGRPDDFREPDRARKSPDGRLSAERSRSIRDRFDFIFGMFPRLKERAETGGRARSPAANNRCWRSAARS